MATKKVGFRQLASHRDYKKNVDSPLAKYNNSGQLLCILCNTPIKNALLWDSHVLGKKHKQNLAEVKSKSNSHNQTANTSRAVLQQVAASPKDDSAFVRPSTKRTYSEIEKNARLSAESKVKVLPDRTSKSILENTGDSFPEKEAESLVTGSNSLSTSSDLPADFFDNPEDTIRNVDQSLASHNNSTSSNIPEGFFDDPKLDAKVRKVEYRDPVEEEWEKFQKAMQFESQVSQSILEGEDEESRVDREFSELSEQRLYFLRADALRDKQNVVKENVRKKTVSHDTVNEEHSSGSDGSDLEEFLDWRAKKAL